MEYFNCCYIKTWLTEHEHHSHTHVRYEKIVQPFSPSHVAHSLTLQNSNFRTMAQLFLSQTSNTNEPSQTFLLVINVFFQSSSWFVLQP